MTRSELKTLGIVALSIGVVLLAVLLPFPSAAPPEVAPDAPSDSVLQAPAPERMNAVLSQALPMARGEGVIAGRVMASGRPVPTAVVTATRAEGDDTLSDLDCECDNHCGQKLLMCGCPEAAEQLKRLVVERRGEVVPVARTQVQEDGSFELRGLEAGTKVALWADDAELGTAFSADVAVGSRDVVVELGGGITVEGRVTIDKTTAASGAWVTLIYAEHSRFFDVLADAEGKFKIGPVPAATYALVGGKTGVLPGHEHIKGAPQPKLELELWTPRTVTGTVELDGKPAQGVSVHLEGNHRKRDIVTRADGTFAFGELRPGFYSVAATQGELRAVAESAVPSQGNATALWLKLENAAIVTGHVTVNGGGAAAGVKVSIKEANRWAEAMTAEDGAYVVTASPGPKQTLWFHGKGFASDRKTVDLLPGKQIVDVEVQREARIKGHVIDAETNQPVAKVAVSANEASRDDLQGHEARTDETGAFEVGGLAPGEYLLRTSHHEYVEAQTSVTAPASAVKLALGRGLSLSGVVISDTGRGVRAEVRAQRGRDWETSRSTQTNDAGVFELRGLTEGAWELDAENEQGSGELTVELPLQSPAPVRIVLARKLMISGVVVDEGGKPVAGVDVTGYSEATRDVAHSDVEGTGVDGKFVLTTTKPGEYELFAMPRDMTEQTDMSNRTRARTGDTDVRVVVRMAANARGRVLDPERRPIKKFRLNGKQVGSSDGRFEMPLQISSTRLLIEADGYLPHMQAVIRRAGDVDLGDIVLGAGREVRIKVVAKATGQPIDNAEVWTMEAWTSGLETRSPAAWTGSDGIAALRGLPSKSYSITVKHSTHRAQRVELAPGEAVKQVELEKGPTLIVTVRDEAGRPKQTRVTVVHLGENNPPGQLPTDAAGVVRFEGMLPGRYVVHAGVGEFGPRLGVKGQRTVTLPESGEVNVTVAMQRGGSSVQLQLSPGPGAWVPSSVELVPAEMPAERAAGLDYGLSSLLVERADETEIQWRYAVRDLSPGTYRAVIYVRDGKQFGFYSFPVSVTRERGQIAQIPLPAPVEVIPIQRSEEAD